MNKTMLIKRFMMIFTSNEIDRISFEIKNEAVSIIKVDVHGLKCVTAKRFINNIINLIIDSFELIIIHGFNHGTAIRDMLRGDFYNYKIEKCYGSIENDGITCMIIHSRY